MVVKVLVVDDSGFFRRRVSEILATDPNIKVVGTATNGREAIDQALALKPDVIIADEPTTALDVTVQAQVMGLLSDLQKEMQLGLILITHDMGVVANVADDICVMYAGNAVEQADVLQTYEAPAHPYTKALLESIPRIDQKGQELTVIKGLPPALTDPPAGCSFHPRCTMARDRCRED
jgi:oligopeptide/dipeptide ABC transporter ATP-binding protein